MMELMRERLGEREAVFREAQQDRSPGPARRGGHRLAARHLVRGDDGSQRSGEPERHVWVGAGEECPGSGQALLPLPGQAR